MRDKLNDKQKLFCLEFLKDMNATRSYREVYGASQKTAETNGSKLLGNTKVQEYLADRVKKNFDKAEKDGQWVLDRLFELVDRCMQKKPVMTKWKNPEQIKETITQEDWTKKEEWVWAFDSAWANSALDKLGKYYKLFTEKIEHSGNISLIDVAKKAKEKRDGKI